jgi:hypothetical protein
METKALSCIECGKVFQVAAAFYMRVHADYACDACAEASWVLAHPHRLSILGDSPNELEAIHERLLRVALPSRRLYGPLPNGGRVLIFWYPSLTHDLLEVLAPLQMHYILHDMHLGEDSLECASDNEAPRGRLAPWILRMRARSASCERQCKRYLCLSPFCTTSCCRSL